MNDAIHLLDVVALTADVPEYDLHRGQVGTVVDILADGQAFEVEFSDRQGHTYESVGLHPDQLMVLHFDLGTAGDLDLGTAGDLERVGRVSEA